MTLPTPPPPRDARKRRTVVLFAMVPLVMWGAAFASVPLYRLICQATGYAGTPRVGAQESRASTEGVVFVRFNGDVADGLPWRFFPEQNAVSLRLGENALTYFRAENVSSEPVTGLATYNVTPMKAARYFNKIQCFCLSEQTLQPREGVDMGVSFYVDPKLAEDPETRDVKTITLSYTFFQKKGASP